MFNFRPYFPWLRFHTGPAEDDPPGFHFNPETPLGAQAHTFSLATPADMPDASRASINGDVGGAIGFPVGSGDPLNPFNEQGAASTSLDGGLYTRDPTSTFFPLMAEPSSFGPGLQDFGGQFQHDTSVPGFRVQLPDDPLGFHVRPSGFWMATGGLDPNALPEQAGLRSFGYTSGGDAAPTLGLSADEALPRGNSQSYSTNPPLYDPVYFPEPPPDRIQQALDEIARIYGLRRFRPTSLVNRPTTGVRNKPANDETGDDNPPIATDVFDPRYILPVQAGGGGARPPPPIRTPPSQIPQGQPSPATRGIGDNKGPPLGSPPSSSTSSSPTSPSPTSPSQGAPAPRAPARVGPQSNQAGPAAAAERSKTPPQSHPNPRVEAVWKRIAKVLNEDAPDPQYDKSSGRTTGVGVFVDRRLPEPAAGWKYNPPPGHLRSGYVGEIRLANRIVTALRNEVVVHYGMPAGVRGPDVISVAPDGTISVWDSKWRTAPNLISKGGHQRDTSLKNVWDKVKVEIPLAVKSGRLSAAAGAKALENADKGNFFVITVGTGNAHGGVVRFVEDGKYSDSGSK